MSAGYKPDWKVIINVGRKQHVMKRSYPKPGEPNRCETCSLYHICIGRYKHRDEELSSIVADVCRITDFGFQEYKADKL